MASEMKKDLDEYKRLIQLSNRQNVRKMLQGCIDELEKSLAEAAAAAAASADTATSQASGDSPTKDQPKVYCSKIESYAWDQSDNFVKIYAMKLPGVQSLPSENVNCHFSQTGFNLMVTSLNGKNHQLQIVSLYGKIIPEESRIKIKTDSVLVMLKKAKNTKWEGITEVERRKKETEKMDRLKEKDEDPSASIMSMMKKMYDEGDDDMKRTIAKAWTESQEKRAAGGGDDM